uniref:Reverse transcriptase domain-containing protein n=1 Tax=Trichuris muris TaxID=70415 RepID=A0A5S6Q2U1_TRIMR
MVSYDVKDLFTSIPMRHTHTVLEDLLAADSTLTQRMKLTPFHIIKFVSFCLQEGNYFRYQDKFFSKTNGAPMGTPLSPILAEIFMEHFEEKAFRTAHPSITPRFFKRYVDDMFSFTKAGEEELFLEHLNNMFPEYISLTIEKETDNKLPFLDSLVIRSAEGFKTTVHRKPTHSDHYLDFSSHHHQSVMKRIINGMVDRAIAICDAEFLEKQLKHITNTLRSNGYPGKLISSIIHRRMNMPQLQHPKEQQPVVVLPYYKGIGERIKRLGRTLNFRIFFKSSESLRNSLRHDKTIVPMEERSGIVYHITCSCNASYIGETDNSLLDRFEEHQAGVTRYKSALDRLNGTQQRRRGRPQTKDPTKIMDDAIKASAVVEHSSQCSGDLQARTICRESRFRVRKIKEAFFIRHNTCEINRDKGVEISELWTDLINETGCCLLNT